MCVPDRGKEPGGYAGVCVCGGAEASENRSCAVAAVVGQLGASGLGSNVNGCVGAEAETDADIIDAEDNGGNATPSEGG